MSFVSVYISMWIHWRQKSWFARVPQKSLLIKPTLNQLLVTYNDPVVLICARMESKSWAPIAWLRFTRRLLRGLVVLLSEALAIVKSEPPRSLFVRETFGETSSDTKVLGFVAELFRTVYFLKFGLCCCVCITGRVDESPDNWAKGAQLFCCTLLELNSEVLNWKKCELGLRHLGEISSLNWKDEEDLSSFFSGFVSIPFDLNKVFPEVFSFPSPPYEILGVSNERAWREIMGSSSSVMLPDSMLSSLVLVPMDEEEDKDTDEGLKFWLCLKLQWGNHSTGPRDCPSVPRRDRKDGVDVSCFIARTFFDTGMDAADKFVPSAEL